MNEADGIPIEILPSNIMTGIAEKMNMEELMKFELGNRMTAAVTQKLPRCIFRVSNIFLQKNPRESHVNYDRNLIENAPANVVFIAESTFISLDIREAFPTIVKHQITSKELYFTNFRERLSPNWMDGFDDEEDDTPPEEYELEVNLFKECIRLMKPEFVLMNSSWPRHYTIPELANVRKVELLYCNWTEPGTPILLTLRNRHLIFSIAHGQDLREMEIADFIQEWIDEKREIEFFQTPYIHFELDPVLDFFPEATTRCDGHAYICRDKDHKECLHLTIENQKKIIVRNTKCGEVPPCPHHASSAGRE